MKTLRLYAFLAVFFSVSSLFSQTITSTTTGGNWEDASTWVGGVVPGINNDVIVNGTVSVTSSSSTCRNFTINAGKVFQNGGNLGWVTFKVNGKITNNGTIRNNPGGYLLVLDLRGDIHNAGTWKPAETYIATKQDQQISQSQGAVFENIFVLRDGSGYVDTTGKLIATSSLVFAGRFDLKWYRIDLNGNDLTLLGASHFAWGTIKNVANLYFRDSTFLLNTTFSGNVNLHSRARFDAGVVFLNDVINSDTMEHFGGLGWVTPIFYGKLTNYGLIRNNPVTGWQIALDLRGDIHNAGVWRPASTYIATKHDQHISQTLGTVFEHHVGLRDGSGYVDTNGILIANSPLNFSGDVDLKWRPIDMNGRPLVLSGGGRFAWGTIRNVPDLYLRDSSYFESITVASPVNLHGIVRISDSRCNFMGDVINVDTLQHTGGLGWVTTTFFGSITNNGVIRNNPINNWGLDLQVHRDVINNGVWTAGKVILDGTGRRTVNLHGTHIGLNVVGKKVVFTGDNYIPTLAMSSAAICYVAADGSLTVEDGATNYGWNGVANLGKIVIPKKTIVGTTRYDFYSGYLYYPGGSTLPDSLIVESYGSTPKTFGNATARWWKLRTVPSTAFTIDYGYCFYAQSDLNGIAEKDLELYRSIDGGITWVQVDGAVTSRDTIANYVRIDDIPTTGDYVLASGGSIPTPAQPNIRVSIIGSNELRVLAPNRLIIHVYNNSASPSGSLALAIEANEKIRFLKTEDELDGSLRTYSVNDFALDSADQYISFLLSSMAPFEERDFTLYATATAPVSVKGQEDPQFVWFVAAAAYIAGAYVTDYITDKLVDACFYVWLPPGTENDKKLTKETLDNAMREKCKITTILPVKQAAKYGAEKILEHNILGKLIWPAELAVNTLSCFENTMKGLQCYMGQKMVRDVFTHVECNGTQKDVTAVTSRDPNHKSGIPGYGPEGFIANMQRMEYMIECENAPDAAAPAYKIVITDSLADVFDENSVVFGRMGHKYTPTRNGRLLRWEITGIDLPPNKIPTEGESWVTYSVMPKAGLPTGTRLGNRASIIFDANPAIITNEHINTLDFAAPSTTMQALPSKTSDTAITVRWTSNDGGGSGKESATLFMAKDDGEYLPVGIQDIDSAAVGVEKDHTYSFFALAKDHAGNKEINRPTPVTIRVTSDVKSGNDEDDFWLRDVYPNPVESKVYFDYALARNGHASLIVIDALGNVVATVIQGQMPVGYYAEELDCSSLATGTYYVRLEQGGKVRSKKFVVVR